MTSPARYRIKITDPAGRWKAGEIGVEMPNDFPAKYDHKLDLGTVRVDDGGTGALFGTPLDGWHRIFYFHAEEVERV